METIYKSIPAIHTDEHWVCKRKERRKEGERERGEKMMGLKIEEVEQGRARRRKQGDRSLEATERQDRDKRGWFRRKKKRKKMDKEGMRPQLQETGI